MVEEILKIDNLDEIYFYNLIFTNNHMQEICTYINKYHTFRTENLIKDKKKSKNKMIGWENVELS